MALPPRRGPCAACSIGGGSLPRRASPLRLMRSRRPGPDAAPASSDRRGAQRDARPAGCRDAPRPAACGPHPARRFCARAMSWRLGRYQPLRCRVPCRAGLWDMGRRDSGLLAGMRPGAQTSKGVKMCSCTHLKILAPCALHVCGRVGRPGDAQGPHAPGDICIQCGLIVDAGGGGGGCTGRGPPWARRGASSSRAHLPLRQDRGGGRGDNKWVGLIQNAEGRRTEDRAKKPMAAKTAQRGVRKSAMRRRP